MVYVKLLSVDDVTHLLNDIGTYWIASRISVHAQMISWIPALRKSSLADQLGWAVCMLVDTR